MKDDQIRKNRVESILKRLEKILGLKEEILEIISKEGGGRESEPLDALTESARLRKYGDEQAKRGNYIERIKEYIEGRTTRLEEFQI
jgi:hypothetical protein